MLIVQRLARVLLQVQPGDADQLRRAIGEFDLDLALAHHGMFVLADLIPGRKIGVEIILAVEPADRVDRRFQAEPGFHRLFDTDAVDHRQHSRKRRVHVTDLRVRLRPERGRRPGKQFRLTHHLGVNLQSDNDFPGSGAASQRVSHGSIPRA